MRLILASLMSALVVLMATPSYAAEPYRMDNIVLLQPESMLVERAPGGAVDVASYIQRINAAIASDLADFPQPTPIGDAIYIAVRPGNRSQAWLGAVQGTPVGLESRVVRTIRAVAAPEITGGTFVFAINVSFWGGPAPKGPSSLLPQGWFEFLEGAQGMEITELVDKLWKAEP